MFQCTAQIAKVGHLERLDVLFGWHIHCICTLKSFVWFKNATGWSALDSSIGVGRGPAASWTVARAHISGVSLALGGGGGGGGSATSHPNCSDPNSAHVWNNRSNAC